MDKVITKAEEERDDMEDGGDKHVGYVMESALGANKEGECVFLPEKVGAALVAAGIARLAKAEDMESEEDKEEEEDMSDDEAPIVANAAAKLKQTMQTVAADVVAKSMKKDKEKSAPVYAEIKTPPFRNNGEYIRSIAKSLLRPEDRTNRNKIAAYEQLTADSFAKQGVEKSILGINETTNSQGGYLVNPQFSPDVYAIPHGQIDLQTLCQPIEAHSNVFNQRYINESALANGSIFGGLNVVATAEGASMSSSLPAWGNVTLTLQKFVEFVYYTNEEIEDASYPIESQVDEYTKKAFLYDINTQIIQGSTLEGAINSPAYTAVTHSSNDTAWHTTPSTNLTYADLCQMWSAVYPDCQVSKGGVWLFHPSLATCLVQMTYTFSGSAPSWGIEYNAEVGLVGNGPGVDGGTPYRIFGKPAYPCWAMSAPGTAGDIMFIDFNTFLLYKRPFRVEVSKEYQFATDQIAIRYVSRLDCKTRFRNPVTGPTGTQSFSALVGRTAAGT